MTLFSKMIIAMIPFLGGLVLGCGFLVGEDFDEWKGRSIEEFTAAMGQPEEQVELPNGGKQLTFVQRITQHPTASQMYGTTMVCRMTVLVDKRGTIQSVTREGC